MEKINVLIVAGTRPELIKLAPVFKELKKRDQEFCVRLCATGQHKEMFASISQDFDITPDFELDVMVSGQTLPSLSGKLFLAMESALDESLDVVIVQGDTTTAMIAGLCGFYKGIRVAHVEAGLRSGDIKSPFPEEANRKVLSVVTDLHFAPTEYAKNNLIAEGVNESNVFVTGNTVIDALFYMRDKTVNLSNETTDSLKKLLCDARCKVLITGHRRESFGEGFEHICAAINELASTYQNVHFIYPVHLNPNVQKPVNELLSELENVHLVDPLGYRDFVWLMDHCDIVLTDSGGIQEEAPSFGKPVLVMREVTERQEGIDAGTSKLVGTEKSEIVSNMRALLDKAEVLEEFQNIENPYGDGQSSSRIADILKSTFMESNGKS